MAGTCLSVLILTVLKTAVQHSITETGNCSKHVVADESER